jgi:hypothetical protein
MNFGIHLVRFSKTNLLWILKDKHVYATEELQIMSTQSFSWTQYPTYEAAKSPLWASKQSLKEKEIHILHRDPTA